MTSTSQSSSDESSSLSSEFPVESYDDFRDAEEVEAGALSWVGFSHTE